MTYSPRNIGWAFVRGEKGVGQKRNMIRQKGNDRRTHAEEEERKMREGGGERRNRGSERSTLACTRRNRIKRFEPD